MSPIIITKELLKSKSPCKDGYIEVLEKYGNNFSVPIADFIRDFPQHREWIENNLDERVQCCSRGKDYIKLSRKGAETNLVPCTSMLTGIVHCVLITFCPFCGKSLTGL